jgi:hypothetical protein
MGNFPLFLRGTAAIVLTVTGFAVMIGGGLITELAHAQKFLGEIEGFSVALVFSGVAVALKTVEKLQMIEDDTLTD